MRATRVVVGLVVVAMVAVAAYLVLGRPDDPSASGDDDRPTLAPTPTPQPGPSEPPGIAPPDGAAASDGCDAAANDAPSFTGSADTS